MSYYTFKPTIIRGPVTTKSITCAMKPSRTPIGQMSVWLPYGLWIRGLTQSERADGESQDSTFFPSKLTSTLSRENVPSPSPLPKCISLYQNIWSQRKTSRNSSAYVQSGRGLIKRNLGWGLHCGLGVGREIGDTQQKRRLRNGQQGEIMVSWRNGTNSSWTRWRRYSSALAYQDIYCGE